VRDLSRSIAFYRDVVGLEPAFEAPGRAAAFLWVGPPGNAMLGLWELGAAPVGITSHVALTVTLNDVLGACDRLRSLGIRPLSFDAVETDEPSVIGWMPAAAVYFRDPDAHLLEYLAMLESAPRPEAGVVTWSQWTDRTSPEAAGETVRIEEYHGPRDRLRPLFAMAEDSVVQLDSYLDAGQVLVAVVGGRIVGHLQLVDDDAGRSEIRNMAVDASHRRRGIGTALIHAAVQRARENRRSRLDVATAAADIENLRFYQRAGFRLRGIERDVFTPEKGYAPDTSVNGIRLCDRVLLDLQLRPRLDP
jgi:ribosomal protein S18 acetylase RimI-like enzyme